MRRLTRKCASPSTIVLFVLASCIAFFTAPHFVSFAGSDTFDFQYDMRSMIQMNPDFSTYPGSDGVIWLKQLDYRAAPHGGVERRSLWILLGRKGIAPRWLNWNIPVPRGGEAEILEASVYSPGTGKKIADVSPVDFLQGEITARTVAFTNLPEEFILVVSYRELFPDRLSTDDLVWIGETLPVWESLIRVTVPAGRPLFHSSNLDLEPKVREVGEHRVYDWRVINTTADSKFSLRSDKRGYVAFGMRQGGEVAARLIKNLNTTAVPPLPAALQNLPNMLGKRLDAKNVQAFLERLYKQPEFILPDGISREIPAEAPWTNGEKVLLAHTWLQGKGIAARLFWQLAYPPDANQPASESMAISPLLEIPALDSKKGSFYYTMEHAPRFGESSASLWGRTVYGVTPDGKIESRKISGTSASENRLSTTFDLRLNEEGILNGTIRLQIRNAWRHFLLPTNPSSDDLISLVQGLFLQAPRYNDIKLKQTNNESDVLITLADTQVIKGTGGRNILVALPFLVPNWFKSLSSESLPYTLEFPFIMDAKITLTLPESTANVMLPTPSERDTGKIKYSESYKLSKKKVLTAEARISVSTTAIVEESVANLNAALRGWHLFMTKSIPVQLNVKK